MKYYVFEEIDGKVNWKTPCGFLICDNLGLTANMCIEYFKFLYEKLNKLPRSKNKKGTNKAINRGMTYVPLNRMLLFIIKYDEPTKITQRTFTNGKSRFCLVRSQVVEKWR